MCSLLVNAQNKAPQVIPPAPESRLFEQYVNCPVSYETGVPDINIPLYEIEVDGLKIPINLSYHASGIRHKQYDGDVAVGWVLNPGYRVTRSVYSRPDEKYDMHPDMEDAEDILNTMSPEYDKDKYLATFCEVEYEKGPPAEFNEKYDSEYDHFCYMLPTSSAHFIISDRTNKEVTILERDNYKVDYTVSRNPNYTYDGNIDQFTITDDQGFVYTVGEKDGVNETGTLNSEVYVTAWPLQKIKSPRGRSVDFEYVTGYEVRSDITRGLFVFQDPIENYISGGINPDNTSYYMTLPFYLSAIKTDKETINIIRDMRISRNGQINSIEIYRNIPQKTLVKKITFTYSTNLEHRILSSVEIQGENSSEKQYYQLTYYPGVSTASAYPDQWGYYRHKDNNENYQYSKAYHKEFENDYWQTTTIEKMLIGNLISAKADRSSNNKQSLHSYSLKTITFPTQGHWEFEYEPNKFYNGTTLVQGGGQRIKQINMYDEELKKAKTLQYKYGANESGIGISSFTITPKLFADETLYLLNHGRGAEFGIGYIGSYTRTYSTDMMGNASIEKHYSIYYPEVAEYEYDTRLSRYNGKTVRTYNLYDKRFTLGDYSNKVLLGFHFFNAAGSNDNDAAYISHYKYGCHPQLTSKTIYAANGSNYSPVFKETLHYQQMTGNKTFPSLKVMQKVFTNMYYMDHVYYVPYKIVESFFSYFTYHIHTGKDLLSKKTNTLYTPQGNVVTTETYGYDSMNRLIKTTQTNSSNSLIEKTMTYPTLASHPALVNKNMVSTVLQTQTKQDGIEIETVKNIYPANSILPSSIQTSAGGTLREEIKFDDYNDAGSLMGYTDINNVSTTYIWAYNGCYPVAEIKNAKCDTVSRKIDFLAYYNKTNLESNDISELLSLQTSLPGSMVTVYTYKPLTGVTSITDSRGFATFYDYDTHGRLKQVYFDNGSQLQIMEAYEYNYKKQ